MACPKFTSHLTSSPSLPAIRNIWIGSWKLLFTIHLNSCHGLKKRYLKIIYIYIISTYLVLKCTYVVVGAHKHLLSPSHDFYLQSDGSILYPVCISLHTLYLHIYCFDKRTGYMSRSIVRIFDKLSDLFVIW